MRGQRLVPKLGQEHFRKGGEERHEFAHQGAPRLRQPEGHVLEPLDQRGAKRRLIVLRDLQAFGKARRMAREEFRRRGVGRFRGRSGFLEVFQ